MEKDIKEAEKTYEMLLIDCARMRKQKMLPKTLVAIPEMDDMYANTLVGMGGFESIGWMGKNKKSSSQNTSNEENGTIESKSKTLIKPRYKGLHKEDMLRAKE